MYIYIYIYIYIYYEIGTISNILLNGTLLIVSNTVHLVNLGHEIRKYLYKLMHSFSCKYPLQALFVNNNFHCDVLNQKTLSYFIFPSLILPSDFQNNWFADFMKI